MRRSSLIVIALLGLLSQSCVDQRQIQFNGECTSLLHMFDESNSTNGYATPFRGYEAIDNMPYILSTIGDDKIVISLINNNVFREESVFQIIFKGPYTVTVTDIEQFDDIIHMNIPVKHFNRITAASTVSVVYVNPTDSDDIDHFTWTGFDESDCKCIALANIILQ